jgi:hypothetical protein
MVTTTLERVIAMSGPVTTPVTAEMMAEWEEEMPVSI